MLCGVSNPAAEEIVDQRLKAGDGFGIHPITATATQFAQEIRCMEVLVELGSKTDTVGFRRQCRYMRAFSGGLAAMRPSPR